MATLGWRARGFAALAEFGLRRPGVLLGFIALLLLVSGVLIPGLGVSTSRTGMVSEEDPQQARLVDFYERFGRPESAVFVVSGADAPTRRVVVDRLAAALSTEPALAGRILARLDASLVAPVALLQRPEALGELRRQLPPSVDLAAVIEGGIPAGLSVLERQIYAQLDGSNESGEASPDPLAGADEGFARLTRIAEGFDAILAGGDPLSLLGDSIEKSGQTGLDQAGYFTTADGNEHLVTVFPELPSDEGVEVAPLVEQMRSIRDTVMESAPEGVVAELTGMPALVTDELTVLQRGLQVSAVTTTIGIALLCLVLFRSIRQTIVALAPLLPGVVGTVAVARLLYDDLNLITSSFVAVLMGLGIDFSVHAIARYNEELRAGREPPDAIREAMVHTGPSILTGAVVTSAAFLTSATTDFTAFGELGIITACGLVIVVVATFVLLPATLRRTPGVVRLAPEPPGLRQLPGIVRRFRRPLVFVGVIVAVGGGFALPQVGFNPRYFDFLPYSMESTRALDRLEYDPIASPVFANLRAESIEDARQMTDRLRALDSVAGVQSPSDLLPPLSEAEFAALRAGLHGLPVIDWNRLATHQTSAEGLSRAVGGVIDALEEVRLAMGQAQRPLTSIDATIAAYKALRQRAQGLDATGQARLASVEPTAAHLLRTALDTARAVTTRGYYEASDLPPLFARRYRSKDGALVALYVVPSGRFWEREVAEQFRLDMVAIDPDVSGLATVHVRHGEIVIEGFQRAAVMAAVLVVLILAIDFRSLNDAILALVPTAIGWLWMVGVMVVTNIRFDVANVVSMPLVLGIGIAFGVHMMHRCREVEANDVPADERLDRVVRGTGGAIAVAALTTIVGFGGLTVSAHGGMTSFGGLMMLGIGTCLLATVLILPALLVMMGRVR